MTRKWGDILPIGGVSNEEAVMARESATKKKVMAVLSDEVGQLWRQGAMDGRWAGGDE